MHSELSDSAYGALINNLRRYGNEPSSQHQAALRQIIELFTSLATGSAQGRVGIPLPVGGGKSQAAACWSWAIWRLQLPLSVAIACNRVDQLAEMREELLKLGVDPAAIGVLHSKHDHPLANTEANEQRQIMLVTHARLQGGLRRLPEYANYQGTPRSLVIYDESLITADHWSIGFGDLVGLVGDMAARAEFLGDSTPESVQALNYLADLRNRIRVEFEAQRAAADPQPVQFPDAPEGFALADLVRALPADKQDEFEAVIEHAGGRARALTAQGNDGFVWYQVTVPDELLSIAVLDASLPIRLLPKLNDRVQVLKEFPRDLVTYENVELRRMDAKSGRAEINTIFDTPARLHAYAAEVANVLTNKLPQTEAVNVWTFKAKGRRDYVRQLQGALARQGVDVRATVEVNGEHKPRINFLTYGMETGTNQYAYAPNSIFVGILHREVLDLAGANVAAHRNLLVPNSKLRQINELRSSEVAHTIYQAAARSAIRYTQCGKAAPGTIWLPIRTPGVLELLEQVCFPGIVTKPWLPRSADWRHGESRAAQLARLIRDALEALPADIDEISVRALMPRIAVEYSEDVLREAHNLLVQDLPEGWEKISRSWRRTTANETIIIAA
jgi:hypothetical protein